MISRVTDWRQTQHIATVQHSQKKLNKWITKLMKKKNLLRMFLIYTNINCVYLFYLNIFIQSYFTFI